MEQEPEVKDPSGSSKELDLKRHVGSENRGLVVNDEIHSIRLVTQRMTIFS